MKTTKEGIELIKEFEGFESRAYLCPAGIPTIGYGFTKGVKLGDTITLEQAEIRLLKELNYYEKHVTDIVDYPINRNQLSALVSLSYNIGVDAFRNSTLVRLLNSGKITEAAKQFDRWVKADGKVLPGLVRRRNREEALFLKPSFDVEADSIKITHPTFFKSTFYSKEHESNKVKVDARSYVGTILPFLAYKEEENHYKITFGSDNNGVKKPIEIAGKNTWHLFKNHIEFVDNIPDEPPVKKPNKLVDKIVEYCESKGYPLSKHEYNLVGISGLYPKDSRSEAYGIDNNPDRWNDSIGIIAWDGDEFRFVCLYRGTTEPGRFYTVNPMRSGGVACLDLGYHKDLWTFGLHKGYSALVQAGTARLIRDRNQNYIRDDKITFESGNGVNLHTCNNPTESIQKWSAGCNVISKRTEFEELLGHLKHSPQYKSNRGCRFDYRLLSYAEL